jgi:molybdopterin-guanine dinucleotide biosynthesis protein A
MNITAAILAGGESKRLGGINKALLEVRGVPLIERVLSVIRPLFDRIVIVTNSPLEFGSYRPRCEILSDVMKNVGPLGGLHAALANARREAVFCLGCDMPYVSERLIRAQLALFDAGSCDALIPRHDGLIEPLHAVYVSRLHSRLRSHVEQERGNSIRSFLRDIRVAWMDLSASELDPKVFSNVNTPDDLRRLEAES